MQLRFPFRRALGVLAVGAVGATTAVLGAPGVAQAELPTWTASGSGETAPLPADMCAVRWTVVGGGAGLASNGTPGAGAGVVTAVVTAFEGDVFTLHPGGSGTDAVGPTPGTGGTGTSGDTTLDGANGDTDGSVSGGGGGAASVVTSFGATVVRVPGGSAAGELGGAGGGDFDGLYLEYGTEVQQTVASSGDPGSITGEGIPCMPAAPSIDSVQPGDGGLELTFGPGADGQLEPARYEYTLDGGATWTTLTDVTWDGREHATIGGLTNGTTYTVALRAVARNDAVSAASDEITGTPFKPIGAPASVEPGTGPAEVTITWGAPSEAGTYELAGWKAVLLLNYEERGGPVHTCEAEPDVRSCTVPAMPGDLDYRVVVFAVDSEGNDGRESDILPVGPVPAPPGVPASDGSLQAPTATTGGVVAGEQVTFSGSGYAPFSVVTLLVYSEPQVLGTVLTDAAGAFTATVTLPEGLAAGSHTLVAAGLDASGEMRYLTLPITVVAAPGTADRLALTGVDVQAPLAGGLAALGIGTALIVVSRRRRAGA